MTFSLVIARDETTGMFAIGIAHLQHRRWKSLPVGARQGRGRDLAASQ